MTEAALARAGVGKIFVNEKKVAEGRIEHTQPMIFSADEGTDVGEMERRQSLRTTESGHPISLLRAVNKVTLT